MILEIACNNIQSVIHAVEGGADRIELFSNIQEGGVTPSLGTMRMSRVFEVPVYGMIRPRGGNFCYSPKEVEIIKYDIESAQIAGLDGIVFGALLPNGEIDAKLCEQVLTWWDKPITFHRAFDFVSNQTTSLNLLIELGFERVLTSGGQPSAIQGLNRIKDLANLSEGNIKILAGAGINSSNVHNFSDIVGLEGIHTTAKKNVTNQNAMLDSNWVSDSKEIEALRSILDETTE